jgi:hypothetical protein
MLSFQNVEQILVELFPGYYGTVFEVERFEKLRERARSLCSLLQIKRVILNQETLTALLGKDAPNLSSATILSG